MSSRGLRKLKKDFENPVDENDDSNSDSVAKGSIFTHFINSFSSQQLKIPSSDEYVIDNNEPVKSKRRRKRRNKQKEKSVDLVNGVDSLKLQSEPEATDQTKQVVDLLKVNIKILDHVAELSRIFGSAVIGEHRVSLRSKRSHAKRGALVLIKSTWPPVVRLGLSMEPLGGGLYTFVHNKEYQMFRSLFTVL
ncbi:unnamed protein product [Heterobilharzia americana]|nr:unnamed protein product [Heterobilharzia americana]